MNHASSQTPQPQSSSKARLRSKRLLVLVVGIIVLYLLVAYVERDYLFKCLEQSGGLSETYVVDDFHKVRKGKNGGGDPWETDGRLFVGIVTPGK